MWKKTIHSPLCIRLQTITDSASCCLFYYSTLTRVLKNAFSFKRKRNIHPSLVLIEPSPGLLLVTSGCQFVKSSLAWVSQHPPVHHPKNAVLGFHGWDETVPQGQFTWSVIFFSSGPFFPARIFSLAQFFFFFFLGTGFLSLFFWPTPDPKFFLGSSYLPQPTYCPSSYQTTYVPHPTNPLPTHLLLHSLPLRELLT
jgi:hypothetical protein